MLILNGTDCPKETFCKGIQKLKENIFFSQLFLFLREIKKKKNIFYLFIFLYNFYGDYIPTSGRRAKHTSKMKYY